MVILAPIAAGLIQMAISRSREYDADAASAKYTGSPDGLIAGLRKLEQGVERVPMNGCLARHGAYVHPESVPEWRHDAPFLHPSLD